jgi:hypothetical protein
MYHGLWPNRVGRIDLEHFNALTAQVRKRWFDDAVGRCIHPTRLKSSEPTFFGTVFVCQKTCVTRVVFVGAYQI